MKRLSTIWSRIRRCRLSNLSGYCVEGVAWRESVGYVGYSAVPKICIYWVLPITLTSDLLIQPIKSNVELKIQPRYICEVVSPQDLPL